MKENTDLIAEIAEMVKTSGNERGTLSSRIDVIEEALSNAKW